MVKPIIDWRLVVAISGGYFYFIGLVAKPVLFRNVLRRLWEFGSGVYSVWHGIYANIIRMALVFLSLGKWTILQLALVSKHAMRTFGCPDFWTVIFGGWLLLQQWYRDEPCVRDESKTQPTTEPTIWQQVLDRHFYSLLNVVWSDHSAWQTFPEAVMSFDLGAWIWLLVRIAMSCAIQRCMDVDCFLCCCVVSIRVSCSHYSLKKRLSEVVAGFSPKQRFSLQEVLCGWILPS